MYAVRCTFQVRSAASKKADAAVASAKKAAASVTKAAEAKAAKLSQEAAALQAAPDGPVTHPSRIGHLHRLRIGLLIDSQSAMNQRQAKSDKLAQ